MLRTKINKTIPQDEGIVLTTNHNFFVRAAIVRVARIALAFVIFCGLCGIFTIIFNSVMVSVLASGGVAEVSILYSMGIVFIGAIFFVYFCYEIYDIIKIHKVVTEIEDNILGVD